ncbi:L1 [Equus caballus papillomavirus 5]|uniref:Major capsid protein L1 n=1 Tax=Equus caballus papillomavirus 5 TaxID=1235429 RepID=K9M9T2_9PAPI|nr:L1 [Equus caballus papillomavirus 5]AFS89116.1 L1 [Equus caballus papillomavirus 5]
MAFWTRDNQKFYLPPAPVTRILSTEEYIQRHEIYYHGSSDRLLSVGHPFFPYKSGSVDIPKVSSNQYRVFKVTLPNPNKFALPDKDIFNPEKNRLVWALRGMEVGRGQPLGVGVTGNPNYNRFYDVENPKRAQEPGGPDNRVNMAFEVKQSQILLVGCKPAYGEYWSLSRPCSGVAPQDAPPIELRSTIIEDGDMGEVGFGNLDFKELAANKSDIPLDLVNTQSKYPDYIRMGQDPSGDSMFFYARREAEYARHFYTRAGQLKEEIPKDIILKNAASDEGKRYLYGSTPSGSVVSSDSQIFNRPYWLFQAQGQNNGVCWHDNIYVTVFDNTRGRNFTISVSANGQEVEQYANNSFNVFLRHVEEFELSFILQLCTVPITSEVVAHLHTIDPSILEDWEIGVNPPLSSHLGNNYRYNDNSATRCTKPPVEPQDPLPPLNFWSVDLSERLSLDLDQFQLGRRFLAQLHSTTRITRKRKLSTTTSNKPKRRRK